MKIPAILAPVALLALTALGGGAAAARGAVAPDPFYSDLLRDGIQSYDRGEFAVAAKRLRLACFGLLDEPAPLAACLTRLAVAQGAAGDVEGFRETFHRITEVEERFGAYSRADLPADVRNAFEQRATTAIPAATLETIPAFRGLLSRKLEGQFAALPPREKRRQLEERLAKEPRNVAWNLQLADLDLSEGHTAAALTRAEQTVTLAPQDAQALCVRGLARAASGRCAEAVVDLDPCLRCGREPRYAAALLGCRTTLGQWRQAEDQVQAFPAAFKGDKRLAALAQRVAKHRAEATRTATSAAPGTAAGPRDTTTTAAAAPPPRAPQSPAGPTGTGGMPAGAPLSARVPPAAAPQQAHQAQPSAAPGTAAGAGAPASAAGRTPAATGRAWTAAERDSKVRAERLLTSANARDLKDALRLAHDLSEAHPDSPEAQYLAAEAAYRNSRWSEAVAYFRRGGMPGDDHPELLFYLAVSLYESGDPTAAAAALKRSLPNLQKTAYVDGYVKRILGTGP